MNDSNSQISTPTSTSITPTTEMELLGAIDIVEAFTALRHELKLQVRGGRELQQQVNDRLLRIENSILQTSNLKPSSNLGDAEEARTMAEALAELEEGLQRAIDSIPPPRQPRQESKVVFARLTQRIQQASWLQRNMAGGLLNDLKSILLDHERETEKEQDEKRKNPSSDDPFDSVRQGFTLLLRRVHRHLEESQIQRVDVEGLPFDAEAMHAIDLVDAPHVPSSHVAEQVRPAYRWRGKILRCAEVRIAK